MLGIPTTGYAVGLLDGPAPLLAQDAFAAFTPGSADPRVARIVAERGGGSSHFMRFTPAGNSAGGSRSVTVAVRVDPEAARAISVRSAIEAAEDARVAGGPGLPITPTRYSLGLARGYQSFARPAAGSTPLSDAAMPDLAAFAPTPGVAEKPSRFAARVQVEEGDAAAGASGGMAPRLVRPAGRSGGDQTVDLAGSYRLTRNLDVTAGVRYSQERARLDPIPEIDKQDSQAVYIGTQFRF